MFVLLKSSNNSETLEFGYTNLTLLVASKEITLTKLILGIPYLKATSTKLQFSKCNVKAKSILTTKTGKLATSVLLHNNKEIILKSLNEIKSGDTTAEFEINNIFLDQEYDLKLKELTHVAFPKVIKVFQQYVVQNKANWPELYLRKNIVIPICTSIGHKSLQINAVKIDGFYRQPEIKTQKVQKPISYSNAFKYIELGSNFLSMESGELAKLSLGSTDAGDQRWKKWWNRGT